MPVLETTKATLSTPLAVDEESWTTKAGAVSAPVAILISIAALVVAIKTNRTMRTSNYNGRLILHLEEFASKLESLRTNYRALLSHQRSKAAKDGQRQTWLREREDVDAWIAAKVRLFLEFQPLSNPWQEVLNEEHSFCMSKDCSHEVGVLDRAKQTYDLKHNAVVSAVRQMIKELS